MSPSPENDPTRARLIEAAGAVFADRGYQAATIREICARAGANIAAVNYHFRDKMGLYIAVLQESMCAGETEDVRRLMADPARSPEEALGLMISGMLHRMYRAGERGSWHLRIMAHELAQPTPALSRVVDEVIGPRYAALRQILSLITGAPPGDEITRLCAHSVIGQVVHYAHARPVIERLWPDFQITKERVDQVAAHITEFSLCAIRAMQKTPRTLR